jgi:hypothetical protein
MWVWVFGLNPLHLSSSVKFEVTIPLGLLYNLTLKLHSSHGVVDINRLDNPKWSIMAKQFCRALFAASSVYPRTSHVVDTALVKANIGSLGCSFLCWIDLRNLRVDVFPMMSAVSLPPILLLSLMIPDLLDHVLEYACCITNITLLLMNCGIANLI